MRKTVHNRSSHDAPHRAGRLVGLALAALLSLQVAAPSMAVAQDATPGANKAAMGMGMGMNALDKMLTKAEATPDQKTKIKAIIFDAFMSLGAQAPAMKATASAFGAALMAPHVDRVALESARAAAVTDVDAFSKVMVKAIGDAAEVLTPEQRAKLAASAKSKTDAQLVRP